MHPAMVILNSPGEWEENRFLKHKLVEWVQLLMVNASWVITLQQLLILLNVVPHEQRGCWMPDGQCNIEQVTIKEVVYQSATDVDELGIFNRFCIFGKQREKIFFWRCSEA